MVVIGEPNGWQRVALGYKGRLLADVTLQRRMSHTAGQALSAAEIGFAYWERVVARLAELNAGHERAWDQVQGQLRGFSSSDDGLIDTAELRLGFRLPPHVTPEQIQALLLAADEMAIIRFSGHEIAHQSEKNTALVRAFLAAIRAHGGAPNFVLKTGTSDMNIVGPVWGCPILAYGPGDSSLDHTPEEHVVLAEWARGVMVLAQVLRDLTGSPPG